jgi:hypothetical protein
MTKLVVAIRTFANASKNVPFTANNAPTTKKILKKPSSGAVSLNHVGLADGDRLCDKRLARPSRATLFLY